jgi:hypothetical protein
VDIPRLVSVLAALAFTSSAYAQEPAAANGDVSGTVLSDPEKIEKAEESIGRMKELHGQVLAHLEDARGESDVVKLNCVNEKLTQIKGLLKVAEQADLSLREAVAKKDGAAESEFSKIGIARVKVEQLRTETEECIGQLAFVVDEKTTVEVETPKNLPKRDVTDRAPPAAPAIRPPVVRPLEASPIN